MEINELMTLIKIIYNLYFVYTVYTGWWKSHFTILNIYYTTTNTVIKMCYISNEREDLERSGIPRSVRNAFRTDLGMSERSLSVFELKSLNLEIIVLIQCLEGFC